MSVASGLWSKRRQDRKSGEAGKVLTQELADLRATMEAIHASQAVIEFDMDGTILSANSNFLQTLGYRLEEILGRHHSLFVDEAYAASPAYEQFWNRLRGGHFVSEEFRRLGKGAREVWIRASYNPVKDEHGQVVKVIKVATDVTQDKLRASEAEGQLKAIGVSHAVIEFELDGTILFANDNFLSVVGYTLDEIKGKHHSLFVDEQTRNSAAYDAFWDALRAGKHQTAEFRRLGKGGREVWIQASYNPILGLDGKPVKVVKYASDITEATQTANDRKSQIEAIQRSQAVIEFDLQGTVLHANDNFLQVMGYELEEIRGAHHSLFVDPDYRDSPSYKAFWEDLRQGKFFSDEFMRIGKGGRKVWIQATYNPIRDLQGRPYKVVKFASDVTQARLTAERVTAQLEDSVNSLNAVAQQMAAGATQTSQRAQSAADTSGQIKENVSSVAGATEELNATVKEIAQNTGETARTAREAREQVQVARTTMQSLNSGVEQIGEITKVISAIAGQTNLLALNATIESARAGEAGKGFAVVANEVKELAVQTARATEEIASRIEAFQRDTAASVNSTESIVRIIERIDDLSSSVAASVEEQSVTVNDIAQNVGSVSSGVQSVANTIHEVSEAASENERAAGETQRATEQIIAVNQEISALFKK